MKRMTLPVLVVSALILAAPAFGAEPKNGIGFGLTGGTVDSDVLSDSLNFTGYMLFAKLGITDHWGLAISYRDMKDDENLAFGEEDSYTQGALHAVYMWRPGKMVRPHVKFGIERTRFEAKEPPFPTLSDDDVAGSVGGGLEVGSPTLAFFGDYDLTRARLFDEDFDFGNLTAGIIFKF
jgi:outer membrane protein with beta-barrel domain